MDVPNGLAAVLLLNGEGEFDGGIPKGDGLGAATPNGDEVLLLLLPNGVGAGAVTPKGDGALDSGGWFELPKGLGDGAWLPKAPPNPKGEGPGAAADTNGLAVNGAALLVVDCCGFPNGEGPVDPPPNGLVFELGAPNEVGALFVLDPNGVELPKALAVVLVLAFELIPNGVDEEGCIVPDVECAGNPNGEE